MSGRIVQGMVLRLDGNSEHVACAYRKIGISEEKISHLCLLSFSPSCCSSKSGGLPRIYVLIETPPPHPTNKTLLVHYTPY